jgi:hypothetical protein
VSRPVRLGCASSDAACEPLFEIVPFLARLFFRRGLMSVIISMLAASVGIMRRIKTLLRRATPLAPHTRRISLNACVGPARATVVLPCRQRVALFLARVLLHLVPSFHNNLRLSSLRYWISERRLTRALAAPSNSGSVQINAVAISRSEKTSHTPRSPEWALGLGRADIHAPRVMPRVVRARA